MTVADKINRTRTQLLNIMTLRPCLHVARGWHRRSVRYAFSVTCWYRDDGGAQTAHATKRRSAPAQTAAAENPVNPSVETHPARRRDRSIASWLRCRATRHCRNRTWSTQGVCDL